MHVAACLAPRADVEHQCGDFGAVSLWIGNGRAPGGCATLQNRGRRELYLGDRRGHDEAEERDSKNACQSHEGTLGKKGTPTLRRRSYGVNVCDARVLRMESAPGTNVSTTNTPPFPCRAEQPLSEIEPLLCFHD